MVHRVVRSLTNEMVPDIANSPLDHEFRVIKGLLKPKLLARQTEAILLFGMHGVGKVMLARALALWALDHNPRARALVVDCGLAKLFMDTNEAEAQKVMEPWLGEIDSFLNDIDDPDSQWILIVEGIEVLYAQETNKILSLLWSRLNEILDQTAVPALVLGLSYKPSEMDALSRSRFGKVIYIKPGVIEEVPSWLEVGGLEENLAHQVSLGVAEIANKWNMSYVAPGKLLRGLSTVTNTPYDNYLEHPADSQIIARGICASVNQLFIEEVDKNKYELENGSLIKRWTLLEDLALEAENLVPENQ